MRKALAILAAGSLFTFVGCGDTQDAATEVVTEEETSIVEETPIVEDTTVLDADTTIAPLDSAVEAVQ